MGDRVAANHSSDSSNRVIGQHAAKPEPPKPTNARTRLLLEGPIISTLLRLGAPNLVVNVILIAVTTSVDAYFIGTFGPSALAGISLVFPLIMLMQQLANASMGGAVASAVARAIGGGRHADASALVFHALVVAAVMAALFSGVVLLAGPKIYAWMGGAGETHSAALAYSNPIFAGALAYWMLSTLTSIVRGTGQAAVLAGVYIGAEAIHILLVPALVFGFGPVPAFAIAGAAIATVASFTISSLFLAWYIASGRTAIKISFQGVRLDRRLFGEILRVGAPMSLQPILNSVVLAVLTGFVATLGATHLAAFGAAIRLEYLLYPLAFSIGVGVLAMVGTNIGAGNTARTERIVWLGTALAAAVTGCVALFALAGPGLWTGLFANDAEVKDLAARYLLITAIGYPFLGIALTLASAFQAAGRARWPIIAVALRAVIVIAGGWLVIRFGGADFSAIALVAAVGLVAYGTVLIAAFLTTNALREKANAGASRS
jgi:putative MATE family efflux protein